MAKAEIIFFFVVMINIIGFYFMTKKFFRKRTVSGKNSSFSTVTKVFSVILNLALAVGALFGVALGLFCISPFGLFGGVYEKFWVSDFVTGLLLCEVSVFVPYGLNVLLYKFWYKKFGLSKWWTFPALVIGAGAFIVCVLDILSERFIRYWSYGEWIWR
ncbi:MAG: hypothetical protein K2J40_02635 [Ruminococcus sp.]|nr:hypothetical protein [Ruminococcus sp.]